MHFSLDGPNGVYEHMKTVINRKGHCLVLVAEGAGQDLVAGEGGTDASGNPILADIGQWFVKQVRICADVIISLGLCVCGSGGLKPSDLDI